MVSRVRIFKVFSAIYVIVISKVAPRTATTNLKPENNGQDSPGVELEGCY
jgi:hypothetical protein